MTASNCDDADKNVARGIHQEIVDFSVAASSDKVACWKRGRLDELEHPFKDAFIASQIQIVVPLPVATLMGPDRYETVALSL